MAPSPSAADLLFAARIALSRQPWLCPGGPNCTQNSEEPGFGVRRLPVLRSTRPPRHDCAGWTAEGGAGNRADTALEGQGRAEAKAVCALTPHRLITLQHECPVQNPGKQG